MHALHGVGAVPDEGMVPCVVYVLMQHYVEFYFTKTKRMMAPCTSRINMWLTVNTAAGTSGGA